MFQLTSAKDFLLFESGSIITNTIIMSSSTIDLGCPLVHCSLKVYDCVNVPNMKSVHRFQTVVISKEYPITHKKNSMLYNE